jgi:23S rRNA (uridine2552-2'-O)-methyltransferase
MYRKDHKDEFYTRKAHEEGYPARSVYKLQGIDERFHIFSRGNKVLDLGSAPGSWLIYLCEKVGKQGLVVGVDIGEVKIGKKPNLTFFKKDVLALTPEDLQKIGGPFDAVVADLAPSTTGTTWVDVGKSLELSEAAFNIALSVLNKGGTFLTKIFDGEGVNEFVEEVKKHFKEVKRVKPAAVIKRSREFYVLGIGYGERD